MAAQPFHRMAPVPPHLTYKPEISTYMDHFRKPQPPLRKRPVMPPQMMMFNRRTSAGKSQSAREKAQPNTIKSSKVKTTVKDYMDSMLQMSDKSFPPFNARVDVPCKTAQPNYRQRDDLKKISRSGFGITDTEARDIVRNDRSVNFHNQHKIAANNPSPPTRVKSAPAPPMTPSKQIIKCQPHWMTWNSGTPEPPGLQKRLHKPWPTPEPPKTPVTPRCFSRNSRSNSAVPRAASGTLLPTKPSNPVPDMIGSEGVNPGLTTEREQAFTPLPRALTKHQELDFAPNFRQLLKNEDGEVVPNTMLFVEIRGSCDKPKLLKKSKSAATNTMNLSCNDGYNNIKPGNPKTEQASLQVLKDTFDQNKETQRDCTDNTKSNTIPEWKTQCYNKPSCLGSRHPFDLSTRDQLAGHESRNVGSIPEQRKKKPAEILQETNRAAAVQRGLDHQQSH